MQELTREYTAQDLLELPQGEGIRYELIEGELVQMTPTGNEHGLVTGIAHGEIYVYLREHPIAKVLAAETGFYTRADERTVRAADVTVIRNENIPPEGLPAGYSHIVPDLVVEVVSTYDRASEVNEKVLEWLNFGVRLVWVFYPKTEQVYVYRTNQLSPEVLTIEDTLLGEAILPDFVLPLRKVFES